MITESITTIVKDELSPYLFEGQIAVDLTAGNGNDTCFLAAGVGATGKVYAFDIQAVAIEKTKLLLDQYDFNERVQLINDGHENMSQYIDSPIHVAMANLGYLPGGDKHIITHPETTLLGISNTLNLLVSGGVMSIVIYYGHEGGMIEKEMVQAYLNQLDEKIFDIISISYPNRKKNAPILYFIHKR